MPVVQISFVSVPKAEAIRPLCPRKFPLKKKQNESNFRHIYVHINVRTGTISLAHQRKAQTRVLASVAMTQ